MKVSTLFFAHEDFESELVREFQHRNILTEKTAPGIYRSDVEAETAKSIVWAQDVWCPVEIRDFGSISEATKILKTQSPKAWVHVSTAAHRRAELISDSFLTKTAKKNRSERRPSGWPNQPSPDLPRNPVFTLLSANRIAFSTVPLESNPGGAWKFDEDREGPPSRAYLKLWEWGWRSEARPMPGQRVLDLGASPGGWTWVLLKAGLSVTAFDRAPLSETLEKSLTEEQFNQLKFIKADAFEVRPDEGPDRMVDWVFCDVIAEPTKTLGLIETWAATPCGLVFTVKFKGEADFQVIDRLLKIEGSHLRHLYNNRHEVTFWRNPVSK